MSITADDICPHFCKIRIAVLQKTPLPEKSRTRKSPSEDISKQRNEIAFRKEDISDLSVFSAQFLPIGKAYAIIKQKSTETCGQLRSDPGSASGPGSIPRLTRIFTAFRSVQANRSRKTLSGLPNAEVR